MKLMAYMICMAMALATINADAASKKKNKKQLKPILAPYVIAIGYPNIEGALKAIKARTDITNKPNARPFGWQQRSGTWYVANEPNLSKQASLEWAFTEPSHYAHPSVIKRMIDIGSTDHVYVDMAFRCGASNGACDKLLTEFKDVNLFIRKVYQKKYIVSADGRPAWTGVDSLE